MKKNVNKKEREKDDFENRQISKSRISFIEIVKFSNKMEYIYKRKA